MAVLLEQQSIDTEAGMLSGISQKHNMRSSPCRFTEFCNSQCISHIAAPFIVVRAETSVAERCNKLQWRRPKTPLREESKRLIEWFKERGDDAAKGGSPQGPPLTPTPPSSYQPRASAAKSRVHPQLVAHWVGCRVIQMWMLIACE